MKHNPYEAAKNTDKEIWRRVPDDYYSPSIHITESGDIGINVGGRVIVASVEKWHLALATLTEMAEENERLERQIGIEQREERLIALSRLCMAIAAAAERRREQKGTTSVNPLVEWRVDCAALNLIRSIVLPDEEEQ